MSDEEDNLFNLDEYRRVWCVGVLECESCHHQQVSMWKIGTAALECPCCGGPIFIHSNDKT